MTGTCHAEDSDDDAVGLAASAPLPTWTGAPTLGAEAETAAGGTPLAAEDAAKKAAKRAPGDADTEPFDELPPPMAASPARSCGGRVSPAAPALMPQATTVSVTTVGGDGAVRLAPPCVALAFNSRAQVPVCALTASDSATAAGCGSPDGFASCVIATVPTGTPSAHETPRRRSTPRLGATMAARGMPVTVTFRGTCRGRREMAWQAMAQP